LSKDQQIKQEDDLNARK